MLLKKLPYPIAGLMLGLAALGNLVMSYGTNYRYALGAISCVIFLALVAKTILYPGDLKSAIEQPPIAGVLPTLSMGMALLAGYIRPNVPQLSLVLWFGALFVHVGLLVVFTYKHVLSFNFKKVFPSWFIVYVGLATFSVTAPAFGQRPLGQLIFWFAFASYFALLPLVLLRILVIKEVPPPTLPLIAIFTAPSSLVLAGYLNSFPQKNLTIVYLLATCTVVSFIGVLVCMPKLLKLQFYPSYSAFTFPFVITGIALKGTNAFLNTTGRGIALLSSSVKLLELWAVVMVAYVLYRYAAFLFVTPTEVQSPASTSPVTR